MNDSTGGDTREEANVPVWPSINDVKPLEAGGPVARKGFNYQDEIAVSFLLDMMEDASVIQVHCETHDDIVLVRSTDDPERHCAEYVQVKATEPDQLWTVATLCKRTDGKVGTSILEKSLSHDKHCEDSRFRVLTLRQVSAELKVLTIDVGAVGREPGCEELTTLKDKIMEKHPELVSPKGNDCGFWVDSCYWDERYDESAVQTKNRLRAFQISSVSGNTLLPDAIDSLLNDLRAWVKQAGAAKWEPDRDKKIIKRSELLAWWDDRVAELTAAGGASGGKLVRKMKAAHLPQYVINLAVNLRRQYAKNLRTPRYADAEDTDDLLSRVSADVLSLSSQYVAGQLDVEPAQFHAMCIDRMDAINAERPAGTPDRSSLLKGCLYDITDRCLLRFERVAS